MPFLFVLQPRGQPRLGIFVLCQSAQQSGSVRKFLAGIRIVARSASAGEDRPGLPAQHVPRTLKRGVIVMSTPSGGSMPSARLDLISFSAFIGGEVAWWRVRQLGRVRKRFVSKRFFKYSSFVKPTTVLIFLLHPK